uniref:Uncharacterized protein n=1 Tax=Heterorhabditis bacteriophora TaxID=37862 RepID=A0A1I7W7E3_HETBA
MRPPRLLYLLLIPLLSAFPQQPSADIFRGLFPIQPPHCSKTPIVIAQASTNANTAVSRGMQMQFYIGLHTTVCFRLDEGLSIDSGKELKNASSWLHTIRLDKLEHHHPVTSCYRTFFPNQAPIGCTAGNNPKLCCDIKFRPYR